MRIILEKLKKMRKFWKQSFGETAIFSSCKKKYGPLKKQNNFFVDFLEKFRNNPIK